MPNHYLKCHCKDFVRCQYKLSTCHILLSNIFRSVYLWKCFSEFALKNGGFHQMVQVQRKAQLNPTTELLNTVNWKVGLTQKKRCRNATIVLSILMKNRIEPLYLLHFSVWPLKIFEVKGGQYAKKSVYQLFKTRICAFMTYVQFWPKSSSNLRSVVWDSRIQGHRAEASKHIF